jgi:CRP-like cAMP-binding protein
MKKNPKENFFRVFTRYSCKIYRVNEVIIIDTNKSINSSCLHCTGKSCSKKVFIFSNLQEAELDEIYKLIITKNYKKGQVIFFQGDKADKLYIIKKGKIKIFKTTKDGKEQILYLLSEGEIIGELSLLKKGEFDFSAEALEDVSLCTLTKYDFDNLILTTPLLVLKILEEVHDRLLGLENLVQQLGTKDVEVRIANLLVSFINNFGTNVKEGIKLDLPLSREEMGNYIGLTRETISRKLTLLQENGIIELIGNKVIIIKDLKRLQDNC